MKKLLLVFVFATFIFAGCKSQSQKEAIQKAKNIQTAVKENTPGTIPTSAGSYTMTAKISGKNWAASSMMPQKDAGYHIIGYYKDEYISLPYSKSDMKTGKKIVFKDGEVAEVLFDNGCVWKENAKGEMNITKADANWVEGTFFFTTSCQDSKNNLEITDGFFRIPVE